MRAHLLPRAQPWLQEVVCVLADGSLRHSVRTNSQEGLKSSSGLLGTGYAGPPRGPVVLDRAPRARVARPPPRTLVRWVSPPNLAAQRANWRPGSSQHRTPIDWAHLVRLGMDCLASLGCCFKQRASNPARDRPTRGPAVSRKALPGRAKAKQPGSLRPPSGPTRVERGRVAPGPGKPPHRRSGHPSAVARLLLHPAHFPQQLGMTVPWGVPAGPGRQAPPVSLAQAAPRPGRLPPAEVAGARRFPCDRPVLRWGVKDGPRRARG
ncbi:hypothetical protein NDU88_004764 [Pleurodeles waltl]|uniref:Uncharacterized protein n=1 Tax=Pleurodeles waltl TaxID=8319 RepID=A0AAV7V1Z1_PLEWA|nr:hypothetical protein NDU88_004764 [Pleurodeles waltl]